MYTHLHVRSAYTLLNSTLRIKDIVEATLANRCDKIALVDKNVMHGALAFYHACKASGIKPIFGLEVDCVYEQKTYSFIVYAKDDFGYKQLLKLSSRINTDDGTLSLGALKDYDKHCIITTAGDNDDLQEWLANDEYDNLLHFLDMCNASFKQFYVSIAMNDSGLMKIKNQTLQQACTQLNIKTFALSRIYFKEEEDEETYKILCAIDQQRNINDPSLTFSSKRYFRSEREMKDLYTEEQLEMSEEIANQCNVVMQLNKVSIPQFKNRFHVDSATYLRNLCKKGLEKRGHGKVNEEYVKRLTYELEVISNMGYADYFLIVYDFIRYAKIKDIYVGPGRGSAAGSLVSYCLGITQVDPLEYDLIFERFLNPERISMPDIDIDFPDNRRDEVIAYVRELYGEDHVAHIITFGTLGAKQVLRDVGRALNIPIREIDMLCKMIPFTPKITLSYTYENVGKFKQTILASKTYVHLYQIALKLEGLPRHASTHAAGIVLSDVCIQEVCPLIKVEDDIYSTQFTMEHLEELGLIKMDFLGLRNLTIIDDVCRHINEFTQQIDIMKIPLNDQKTFQLIQEVDTVGIFQLESDGMKNLIRKMKPKNFEEIVASIALFRPGPMENIPLYLENKAHVERIHYLHEDLKDILKNTYGVMIYQEQIMQVTQKMAGFSLAKADILRKAISKKKSQEIASLQKSFIEGSIANGYDEKLARDVYELIMKFAGYGFNRSHSVAYGLIAYQLAYLKANQPLFFFTSLLNSVIGSEYKTSEYIFEARKRKIIVLHPSVNDSANQYLIEGNKLRFPLLNIKNVGVAAAKILLEEREKRGMFKDFFDFITRISIYRISKKVIESLIDAGALDTFNLGRISMKLSLEEALRFAALVCVEKDEQISINLQIVSKPSLVSAKEDSLVISENEKNVLGFYLSKHPIAEIRQQYVEAKSIIEIYHYKGYVKLVCYIEKVKEHRTKNGELMAFIIGSDETAKMDIVCMPTTYQRNQDLFKKGNYLYIEGKIDKPQSCVIRKVEQITSKDGMN